MISRISSSRLQRPVSSRVQLRTKLLPLLPMRNLSTSWGNHLTGADRPSWTQEWKDLGLGCTLVDKDDSTFISNLFFVQVGFGVDQHGENDATKAATRAVRNAIEFNSIPGVVEAIPGGRRDMLIQVKLGIPAVASRSTDSSSSVASRSTDSSSSLPQEQPMTVDPLQIAKVFPYGRLLPIEMVVGGLSFATGRLVPELGDTDDLAVCVAACVSIGYNNGRTTAEKKHADHSSSSTHIVYSTREGF